MLNHSPLIGLVVAMKKLDLNEQILYNITTNTKLYIMEHILVINSIKIFNQSKNTSIILLKKGS